MLHIIYTFLGGICLLIFGVRTLNKSLDKASNSLIIKLLSSLTQNVYLAFIIGTAITAFTQSSTAVTLITVSFVNSKILNLKQAVGIIYGANLGTTITAQLMSINLANYCMLIFSFGFLLSLISTKRKTISLIGKAVMGVGLMFLGINTIQSGIPYIKESEQILQMLESYSSNPIIAIIMGTVLTMLIQSSSATVGMTILLFNEGLISLPSAIALTLGDNIGTCMTAQLASLGSNLNARRTAWAHTLYNVFGVLLVILVLFQFTKFVEYFTFDILHQTSSKLIANTHTLFNIISAAIFLPLTKYYVQFIECFVKNKRIHSA